MTSSVGLYVKSNILESNSFDDDLFDIEEDNYFESEGFMYKVPITPSSVDRSSIGSIPWADDAIKINKLEWRKVENMLSGLEPLSSAEEELRNEILDWQKKFPQLLNKNKHKKQGFTLNTLNRGSLPSVDLTSEDEWDETEATVTRGHVTDKYTNRKTSEKDSNSLCQLMDNFTLKSIPFKLNERETNKSLINKRKRVSSTSSYSVHSPSSSIEPVPLDNNSTNRFRMPPILNVLESTRKFRNLRQNKNQSFVQLTQIQQAKSAAIVQEQTTHSRFQTGRRSAWHVPLAANRFSNNRNSILLPSISTTQKGIQRYCTQPKTNISSDFGTPNSTPSSGEVTNLLNRNNNLSRNLNTTNSSTHTNTSLTPTGRSISAAIKYPRVITFNALYLPYSASKFHAFK